MKFSTMKDLQDALPKGIKVVWVRGQLHYIVRSSKNGKKVSLGTYLCPDLAKQALAKFKAGLPLALSSEELQAIADEQAAREAAKQRNALERASSVLTKTDYFKILYQESKSQHIDSTKPYYHFTEDGKQLIIPAKIVAEFIAAWANNELDDDIEYIDDPDIPEAIDKDLWKEQF